MDNNFRSKTVKVIFLIIIGIIIFGLWAVKNNQSKEELVLDDNPDFALHVIEQIDLEKLKSYGIPIVIDFGADSCIPCKEMAPVLKELNEELRGKAIIKFVDVWKYQAIGEGYPLSVIPTQVFIDADGNAFVPKDPVEMKLKLFSLKDTGEHVFTTHEGGMTRVDLLNVLDEMGVN